MGLCHATNECMVVIRWSNSIKRLKVKMFRELIDVLHKKMHQKFTLSQDIS